MGHVALAWLLSRPASRRVLLGARTIEQLRDNLGAADLVLDADQLDRFTAVSAFDLPPYPCGMIEELCDVDVWQRPGTATPS